MPEISTAQYNLVYNMLSFTVAVMAAATLFFWLGRQQLASAYKLAITITGLVTFIAGYHYLRILESWDGAYEFVDGAVVATGQPFNDAYRYVDWLLTVPLLLVELILVMRLPKKETVRRGVRLGALAALMIALGYPGEVAEDATTRWIWWAAAMLPFAWIVYELFVGLSDAIERQPDEARPLVSRARSLTVVAWLFYPIVFLFPMIGVRGPVVETAVQVGYSLADITAKAVFGVLIYMIAVRKSAVERGEEMPAEGEPSAVRRKPEAA